MISPSDDNVVLRVPMQCLMNEDDFTRTGQITFNWDPKDPLTCTLEFSVMNMQQGKADVQTWICSYEMLAQTAWDKSPGVPVGEGDIQFAVNDDTTQFMIRLEGTDAEGAENVMACSLPCFLVDLFCNRVAGLWDNDKHEESYLQVAIGDIERWMNEQAKPKE